MPPVEELPSRLEGSKTADLIFFAASYAMAAVILFDSGVATAITPEPLRDFPAFSIGWRLLSVLLCLALGTPIGLLAIPGRNCIELDENGFSIRILRRPVRREWTKCSLFTVRRERHGGGPAVRRVAYDYPGQKDDKPTFSELMMGLRSSQDQCHIIPGKFGMKPEELSELFNAYRRKARQNNGKMRRSNLDVDQGA